VAALLLIDALRQHALPLDCMTEFGRVSAPVPARPRLPASWHVGPVGVQTLAGVLLPSATVFLLLLCNDRAVLGPWVNGRLTNLFTGAVIAVPVLLSVILTASVLYPDISGWTILLILAVGGVLALIVAGITLAVQARGVRAGAHDAGPMLDQSLRNTWRMPPLNQLTPNRISGATRIWMFVLRGYLVIAVGMVVFRLVQLAVA